MPYQVPEPKIFACTQSTALGEKIAASYGTELGKVK
ncbi:MAG: ribose-phosphate pyrophosphokinase, partial [Croceitalea sp.]|nr:ribose-phosphate pyrophosphokinase [Croceitalea sp.]